MPEVHGSRNIAMLILKIIGTILLIGITTAIIFACIFTVYLKSNLTTELDISLDDFSVDLTTVLYNEDPATGEYVELVSLQTLENRIWLEQDEIPLDVQEAVIAIEDQRFYKHSGVDWFRTSGAFFNMFLSMRDTFGGSTITQQLIKNLTDDKEATVQRKVLEIFRALELEKQYDKDEIIQWYLNIVYFGHGQYGIGAAAKYYFDKEASELTVAEIASIVGITNNPSIYSPYVNPEKNKERQETILLEMYRQNYLTKDEYEAAVAQELQFDRGELEASTTTQYSYFVDAVIEDVIADFMEIHDCSYDIAEQLLLTGGYKIYTTIDTNIQEKVDSVYEDLSQIPKTSGSRQQLQSAIVITDPYTGDIVALSGGVGEKAGNRVLNRATGTHRPPGSSIKPIAVYAPAMENGLISPETNFEDSAEVRLKGTSWMPKNDSHTYSGIITIRDAIRRSVNTVAAQVLDRLTPQKSYDFMTQKLGVTSLLEYKDGKSDIDYAPLSMGQLTYGITVREMAAAYTIFPNGGVCTGARTYSHIYDSDGELLFENKASNTRAVSEAVAYWMTNMLQGAVSGGTGTGARLPNMPAAGKTGTTSDNCDRWFCGFTPYYVAAVWTGYDLPEKIRVSGNPASNLFKKVMTLVHEDLEYKNFQKPENSYIKPVHNDIEQAGYIVRGVTESGEVLYEHSENWIAGREVTVTADTVEGYELIGESTVKVIVAGTEGAEGAEGGTTVVTFIYRSLTGEPPVDDPNAPPVDDPNAPPVDTPTTPTDPVAPPTSDPSVNAPAA